MTNIMAVTVGYGKDGRAVYICTDSQGGGRNEKRSYQKLFLRKGNLIAVSGREDRARESIADLEQLKDDMPPGYVSERLVDFGRKSFKFVNGRDGQAYIVVGREKGKPVIYYIDITEETLNSKSGIEPIRADIPHAFSGSGSRKTWPAFERDIETGNIFLRDLAEGMCFCHSIGQIAQYDLSVDDRLQIGLVTPEITRLLYHPSVPLNGKQEVLNYLCGNIDVKLAEKISNLEGSDREQATELWILFHDLYHALLVTSKRMTADDIDSNVAHTSTKADFENREKHEEARRKFIQERDREKGYVDSLVGAWLSGDLDDIRGQLIAYNARRVGQYGRAIDLVAKLRGPKISESKPVDSPKEELSEN